MASGEKIPNTNLNLIQDTDMIDYEDINAIAQTVGVNATDIGRTQLKSPIKYLGSAVTDLDTTLELEFLGNIANGPSGLTGEFIYFNQQFYNTVSVDSPRRQFAQSYTYGRIFTRVKSVGQPFTSWLELT